MEGPLAEVEDDGDAIALPLLERTMTTLWCPGRGLGLSVVTALSSSFEVELRQNGRAWHQSFARGVAVGAITGGAWTPRMGMRLRFRADAQIFRACRFDRMRVRDELLVFAAAHPAVAFELMAERVFTGRCESSNAPA